MGLWGTAQGLRALAHSAPTSHSPPPRGGFSAAHSPHLGTLGRTTTATLCLGAAGWHQQETLESTCRSLSVGAGGRPVHTHGVSRRRGRQQLVHSVGDPVIWVPSASRCRGWGRWRLKLGVTCPPWVGVVGCGEGGDFLAAALHFPLALGPGNYVADSDCQNLCSPIPSSAQSPRLLCDVARWCRVRCGARAQILPRWVGAEAWALHF